MRRRHGLTRDDGLVESGEKGDKCESVGADEVGGERGGGRRKGKTETRKEGMLTPVSV
jgi:hypothetical protein